MAKPTYQDANILLKLMKLSTMAGLPAAMNWMWSDQFILGYEDFIKKYPVGSEEYGKVSKICGHYETIGTLWKHKLINEELLFDWLAVDLVWNRVKGYPLGIRQEANEPRLYENFEAMAKAAVV